MLGIGQVVKIMIFSLLIELIESKLFVLVGLYIYRTSFENVIAAHLSLRENVWLIRST